MTAFEERDLHRIACDLAGKNWGTILQAFHIRGAKKRQSGVFVANCVSGYHDDTHPSLHFWPSRTFLCHGCHVQGSVLDFVLERQFGVTFSTWRFVQNPPPETVMNFLRGLPHATDFANQLEFQFSAL